MTKKMRISEKMAGFFIKLSIVLALTILATSGGFGTQAILFMLLWTDVKVKI